MGRLAIKVEQLSKAYQLGQIGTGTISRDLERWWTTKVLRKDDPFLQIGQTNDRTTKGDSDIVWSLRDLNFEVEQGEVLGVIGRNGAGKSTLLKLLSRVTAPTDGRIKIKGRIASLLEVGTGFHPELTGRENIFLNGAILGMRKQEIAAKFDEIVAFSGVERYIDTPVKRYSSGMYVRLAFAVAAHLVCEILIVDEVLAVGDAEFQKKCLGKISEVSRSDGKTVLFVSHNMSSIDQLCSSALLLVNGALDFRGPTKETINRYLISDKQFFQEVSTKADVEFLVYDVTMKEQLQDISQHSEIIIYIKSKNGKNNHVGFTIFNEYNVGLFSAITSDAGDIFSDDAKDYAVRLPSYVLLPGIYRIEAMINNHQFENVLTFTKNYCDSKFINAGNISKGLMMSTQWVSTH